MFLAAALRAAAPFVPALVRAPQYSPANRTVAPCGRSSRAELESNVLGSPSVSTYRMSKSLSARPAPPDVAPLAAPHEIFDAFVCPEGQVIRLFATSVMSPLSFLLKRCSNVAAEATAGASAQRASASTATPRARRKGGMPG